MKLNLVASMLIAASAFAQAGPAAPAPPNASAPPRQQTQSESPADEAKRLSQSVAELYKQKKYDEALPPARRAVELAEKAYGPEHRFTGSTLANLAVVLIGKKQLDEALRLYERILTIREKATGPSLPFERTAFEIHLCAIAGKAAGNPTAEMLQVVERLNRVVREDSIIAQGFAPPFAAGEISGGGRIVRKDNFDPKLRWREKFMTGSVAMLIEVSAAGEVTQVKALPCADRDFARMSEQTVRGFKYEPTLVRGKPVKVIDVLLFGVHIVW